MNKKDVDDILKEFGAKDEEDLKRIIEETWNIVNCTICGEKIDILKCSYEDGDPVCRGGCR